MSVLLSVIATAALRAEVIGHAQVVDTGELVVVRSSSELALLLQRLASAAHDEGDPS